MRTKNNGVFYSVTFGSLILLTWLVYLAYNRTESFTSPDAQAIIFLEESFQHGGIREFLKQKENLKVSVRHDLKAKAKSKQMAALNTAVYLFPELLTEGDLEADVGADLWLPMQKKIEEKPKSIESQKYYERMEAQIWNYESPSKENPQLTEQASQVLRIYKSISH